MESAVHDALRGLHDDDWLSLHLTGLTGSDQTAVQLPPLPPEDLQLQFTGRSGEETLRDGFRNYLVIRDLAAEHLGTLQGRRTLEFGCGWGRIIRFFAREFPAKDLVGVDCEPTVLDYAKQLEGWAEFELVPPLPPSGLRSNSFDLVYSYSVFSHLGEQAHLAWLRDFAQILRPGGVVLLTTRPREFVLELEERRRQEADSLPAAFHDVDSALATYDAGEYLHAPTGGGGTLDASFFGETCIPRAYVEKWWPEEFELLTYLDDREACEQNVIVARRVEAA